MSNDTKRYLLWLRVNELQEVCVRLGLKKSGRKAELQQRITTLLDDAARLPSNHSYRLAAAQQVIEEVYKRNTGIGSTPAELAVGPNARPPAAHAAAHAAAAAAAGAAGPSGGDAKRQRVGEASSSSGVPRAVGSPAVAAAAAAGASNTAIRCHCGLQTDRGGMLQCEGDGCHVWQHADCVGYRGEPLPAHFWCERCRAQRADPFWAMFEQVVPAAKLQPLSRMPLHSLVASQIGTERTFNLSTVQHELLRRKSDTYQLKLFCLQLKDPVPFRYHWPLSADLTVNAIHVRCYARNYNTKLGPNQRDEAVDIGAFVNLGRNMVKLQGADAAGYVTFAAIMRRLSTEDVKGLMQPPDPLPKALNRIQRQLHHDRGGDGSDDEIEIGNSVLSLRDPITGTRMTTPARFSDIEGLNVFDLDPFLAMAQRTLKWLEPHSLKSSCIQHLQVDAYVAAILAALARHPSVTEVEVKPDGSWRPSGSTGRFFSVLDADVGDVFAPEPTPGSAIKEEPGLAAEANGVAADAAVGADGAGAGAGAMSDDESEEEDAAEELRRAAAAVAAATATRRAKAAAAEVIDLISDDEDDLGPFAAQTTGRAAHLPAMMQGVPSTSQQHQQRQRQQQQQGQQQRLASSHAPLEARASSHARAGAGPSSVAAAAGAVGASVTVAPSGGLRIRLPPRRAPAQQLPGQLAQPPRQEQQGGVAPFGHEQGAVLQQQRSSGSLGQQLGSGQLSGQLPAGQLSGQLPSGHLLQQGMSGTAPTLQIISPRYANGGMLSPHGSGHVVSPAGQLVSPIGGQASHMTFANGGTGGYQQVSHPMQQHIGQQPYMQQPHYVQQQPQQPQLMYQQQQQPQLLSYPHVQQQQQAFQQAAYATGAPVYSAPVLTNGYTTGPMHAPVSSGGVPMAHMGHMGSGAMQGPPLQQLLSSSSHPVLYQQPAMASRGPVMQSQYQQQGNGMYAASQPPLEQQYHPANNHSEHPGDAPQQDPPWQRDPGLHNNGNAYGAHGNGREPSPSIADLICLVDSD